MQCLQNSCDKFVQNWGQLTFFPFRLWGYNMHTVEGTMFSEQPSDCICRLCEAFTQIKKIRRVRPYKRLTLGLSQKQAFPPPPRGNHHSDHHHSGLVLPLLELHRIRIIGCAWLLSVSRLGIHPVVWLCGSVISVLLCVLSHVVAQFIHSPVDGIRVVSSWGLLWIKAYLLILLEKYKKAPSLRACLKEIGRHAWRFITGCRICPRRGIKTAAHPLPLTYQQMAGPRQNTESASFMGGGSDLLRHVKKEEILRAFGWIQVLISKAE